jgi:hypothetical protein
MKLKKLRNKYLAKSVNRKSIIEIEDSIKNMDGSFIGDSVNCPLKHSFSDGIYVREIFIPANTILTGKIHKHDHPNFLLKGKVVVATEFGGVEELDAPLSMISKAGTKRVVQTITDTVWVTIHHNPTNTQDLEKLERDIIAKDYQEYDSFRTKRIGLKNIIFAYIKKYLNI